MWTSASIRRYIYGLPHGKLFTTRECLRFGRRSAVDQCLYRMVKNGFILRIARGVFLLNELPTVIPSLTQIARTKAEAFGKHIFIHGCEAARKLGIEAPDWREGIYAVQARSSSFAAGKNRIELRGIAPRKTHLGDTTPGLVIRALWHMRRFGVTHDVVRTATRNLNRSERKALLGAISLLPSWMTEILFGFA